MAWFHKVYILSLLGSALMEDRIYKLVVSYGKIAPDSYLQQAILINGQFPGPKITAKKNDTLIIYVTNDLDHGLTIHLHGIHQKGTQRSDGVPHVTQELIPPKSSYKYLTHIGTQSGTYVYHAHTLLDLVWAYGALIIDDSDITSTNKNYYYDERRVVLISQCWHTSIADMYKGITGSPFVDIPDTSSILINGHSYGIWSKNNADEKNDGYSVINVEPNKIYRFHVIGIGSDSLLTFAVDQHPLTIIEVDGSLVDPVVTDHLEINSAQRYSVLIKTDKHPKNYIIKSKMKPGPGPDNGIAILHYKGAPNPKKLRKVVRNGQTKEQDLTLWVMPRLHPSKLVHQPLVYNVPSLYDRQRIIESLQSSVDGYTNFYVNHILFVDPKVNFLKQVENGVNIAKHPGVYEVFVGEKVQIVFQNRFSSDGVCEQHPWHMHGHTFYVVGVGADHFDPKSANPIINQNIAKGETPFRDVLTLFANRSDKRTSVGTPCGWAAIRFIANNPGVWLAHCHLTAHMIMGKRFVLYEHAKH
jgi:L-ascorbate oxidase